MLKKYLIAAALCAVPQGAPSAGEQAKLFAGVELLTPGSAPDGILKAVKDYSGHLVNNIGYEKSDYNVETEAIYGLRLGYIFPFLYNIDLGASVERTFGPNFTGAVTADGPYLGRGKWDIYTQAGFTSFLAELSARLPMNDSFSFTFSGGTGYAIGEVKETWVPSGSLTALGAERYVRGKTWSGTTWEAGAGMEIGAFSLGLKLINFPELKGRRGNLSRLKWTPLALTAGFNF